MNLIEQAEQIQEMHKFYDRFEVIRDLDEENQDMILLIAERFRCYQWHEND